MAASQEKEFLPSLHVRRYGRPSHTWLPFTEVDDRGLPGDGDSLPREAAGLVDIPDNDSACFGERALALLETGALGENVVLLEG